MLVGIRAGEAVDVAGGAAERGAEQDQGVVPPDAGGRPLRHVAEGIEPEQFREPILAVEGEEAVSAEGGAAVLLLAVLLDDVEAVELDPR
jgi:hypothetical protein